MKKIMVVAAVICATIFANGATVLWNFTPAAAIPGANGSGTYNGPMTVYAFAKDAAFNASAAIASWEVTASAGTFTVTDQSFAPGGNDVFTPDTTYSFYLYAKSDNLEYIGTKTNSKALGVGSRGVTLKAGEWSGEPGPGPDPIPEPTSGLLAVLGFGLMAIRRNRK